MNTPIHSIYAWKTDKDNNGKKHHKEDATEWKNGVAHHLPFNEAMSRLNTLSLEGKRKSIRLRKNANKKRSQKRRHRKSW